MSEDIPDLEHVAKTLVDYGAVYVAANEQSLVDESAQVYYHLPAGGSDEEEDVIGAYLAEEVGCRPEDKQIGAVRIDDQLMPTCVYHVLHNDIHLYRRVPIYVGEDVFGLDPVGIEEGVANAREIVAGEAEPSSHPAQTVELEGLVENLADAGAASVEMSHDFLSTGEPTVQLRIPMKSVDGKPIVGPVDRVEIDGETYPFHSTLTMYGPYGSTAGWTALYVSDSVRGCEPVPIEEGIDVAREVLGHAENADTLQDLESKLNR